MRSSHAPATFALAFPQSWRKRVLVVQDNSTLLDQPSRPAEVKAQALSVEAGAAEPPTPLPKPRDWLAIRKQYETSNISQRQLASILGISESTVMKRAMREKWKQNAKLVKHTANELAAEIDDRVKTKLRQEMAPWMEEQRVKFTKSGVNLATTGVARVERFFESSVKIDADEEAKISKAAETYHRIGRVALGMGDGSATGGAIRLDIMANQAAVQVVSPASQD